MVSRERSGFTLNIIDTPGIVEGGYVNDQALEIIKRLSLLSMVFNTYERKLLSRKIYTNGNFKVQIFDIYT